MKMNQTSIREYGYCLCGCGQKTSIGDRNDKRRNYVKGQPNKYISGHTQVINKLNKSMYKTLLSGCWEWQGCMGSNGYGVISYKRKRMTAHRAFYLEFIGDIPKRYVIDHQCHNNSKDCSGGKCNHRKCVNPKHLEAVTIAENVRRGFKSRLTRDKVEVVRAMYKIFSYSQIAKIFKVSTSTIQKAVENKTWKL